MSTHGDSTGTAKFPIKTTGEGSGNGGLVGVVLADDTHQDEDGCDKGTEEEGTVAGLEVGVGFGGEETKSVVVLVDGLAEVATLLLVPPVTVRVAEGALDCWRVDVSTVLHSHYQSVFRIGVGKNSEHTMPMSSTATSPTKFSLLALFSEAKRNCVMVVRGATVRTALESGRAAASLRESIWKVVNERSRVKSRASVRCDVWLQQPLITIPSAIGMGARSSACVLADECG